MADETDKVPAVPKLAFGGGRWGVYKDQEKQANVLVPCYGENKQGSGEVLPGAEERNRRQVGKEGYAEDFRAEVTMIGSQFSSEETASAQGSGTLSKGRVAEPTLRGAGGAGAEWEGPGKS